MIPPPPPPPRGGSRAQPIVAGALGVALAACVLVSGGCQSEEKILKYKPFLSNLPVAAVTQQPAVGVEDVSNPLGGRTTTGELEGVEGWEPGADGEPIDPTQFADGYYERLAKLPDHMVHLEAGNIGALINHLRWTLDEDRDEVLIDQLLSDDLLEELRSRDEKPEDYVDWLHDNRREIEQMLARMPMADRSPTVLYEQTAPRQYCVRLSGAAENGMKFTQLWVTIERGKYRLLWIS